MDTLIQDLRYAFRTLLRAPGFALAAIVTLALGIGANTAIFSAVNTVLFRPPARVANPGSLISMYPAVPGRTPQGGNSYPDYLDVRAATSGVFTGLAAHAPQLVNVAFAGGEPRPLLAELVSGNYFGVLGVTPQRGRGFVGGEDVVGAPPVAVISHLTWERHFGSDPRVVGRQVKINGQPLTVVGVAPAGFTGTQFGSRADFWIPFAMSAAVTPGTPSITERGTRWIAVLGRLRPGVTRAQASAAVEAVGRRLGAAYPAEWTGMGNRRLGLVVTPLSNAPPSALGAIRGVGMLLMGVVGLVLVICCANVANLLLARAAGRSREIAIRLAMGAARGRIIRQMLTESMVLAVLGGGVGIATANALLRAAMGISLPVPWPVALDLSPDVRVMAFAAAVTLVTGALFGVAPALRASRPDLVPELKDEALSGGGRRRFTLRNGLVVAQVSLSLVLLLVAGLLVRSLGNMQNADGGYRTAGVALVSVAPGSLGSEPRRLAAAAQQMEDHLRAVPGVRSAAGMRMVPLSGNDMSAIVRVDGKPEESDGPPPISGTNAVGTEFFATLGVPVLSGRVFSPADRLGAPAVAVVNQSFARRFWPGTSPLGHRISDDDGRTWREVVGVVRDARYVFVSEDPQPHYYVPLTQSPGGELTVAARVDGDPAAVLPALRRQARALFPELAVSVTTLDRSAAVSLLPQRMMATLLAVFGGLGMLLAAVGLYGVMAYSVSRRRKEIGVRVALGASAGRVVRLVVRQAMGLAGVGLVIGLALAAAITHLMAALLYGVSPVDPVTFLGVTSLLAAVALVASWIPARRASRVDPMSAIRAE